MHPRGGPVCTGGLRPETRISELNNRLPRAAFFVAAAWVAAETLRGLPVCYLASQDGMT